MRFGIFFELSVPRGPDGRLVPGAERVVYQNALEQARVADEIGLDWAWAVEHHFLEEYSHCSAPEEFLTAVAMTTQQIRVGHGAVVCVPEMNHPIRVAERAAVLDILSGGRLEVGTARSSTWTELGGFGADPDTTKATWSEFVKVLPKMWAEERFSWSGECFSMPERNVLPKPLQKPHPPLWVTVTTPGTELDAADRGIGCLGVATVGYGEQETRTQGYHQRIRNCDPVGAVNAQVTTQNFLFCHDDLATAVAVGGGMAAAFSVLNSHLLWTREAYPTSAYHSLGNQGTRASQDAANRIAVLTAAASPETAPDVRKALPEGVCIGDPEHIVAVIKQWESIGVDGINFIVNTCEMIPQVEVLASLRRFATEVLPKFRPNTKTA